MGASPTYPTRPKFFAVKFTRLVMKACVANELGPEAALLLLAVASTEDARGYRGPVNFWNAQLMPLIGCRSESALKRVRAKCEKAGWLVCVTGSKWSPPSYWVTIPSQFGDWDDGATDDGAAREPQASGERAASGPCVDASESARRPLVGGERAASGRQPIGERPDSFPYPSPSVPSERGEGEPPASPAKVKKPRKEPTGPHAEACRVFTARWAEAYPGGDPYPFEAKDGVAVAGILKHVGADLEKFRAILDRYFANAEPFFAGHPLPKLRAQLARFLVDAPPAVTTGPPRRGFETHDERLMGEFYDALRPS